MSYAFGWSILKRFSCSNRSGFSLKEVVAEFPEKNSIYISRVLIDMVEKGMLIKVAKNIYHIIPLNEVPESYIPPRYLMIKHLMQNKAYYIGFSNALELLGQVGLFEKDVPDSRISVVTDKVIKPSIRSVGENEVRFIYHDFTRFFGFKEVWVNQKEKVMASDFERTLVDMASQPHIDGLIKLGKAFFYGKRKMDQERLFFYLSRNKKSAAIKRILFLTELLGMEWTADHDRLIKEVGSGTSLLDPALPNAEVKAWKFGLKINLDPENLKRSIYQS